MKRIFHGDNGVILGFFFFYSFLVYIRQQFVHVHNFCAVSFYGLNGFGWDTMKERLVHSMFFTIRFTALRRMIPLACSFFFYSYVQCVRKN